MNKRCEWELRPTERRHGKTSNGKPYRCGSMAFNDFGDSQCWCDKHMQMESAEKAEARVKELESILEEIISIPHDSRNETMAFAVEKARCFLHPYDGPKINKAEMFK